MTDLTGLTIILTIIIIMIKSLKVLNDAREHVKLFFVICNNYIHNDNYTVCYLYLCTLKGRCLSLRKYEINKLKRQNGYENRRDNLQLGKMVIRTKFGTKLFICG